MKKTFIFKNLKDIQTFLASETFRLSYSNFTKEYHLVYLTEDNVLKEGEIYEFFDKSEDKQLTIDYCFGTILGGGGFSIYFNPLVLSDILPHNL